MSRSTQESRRILYAQAEKYFVFSSLVSYLLSTLKIDESSPYEQAVYACFNAFGASAEAYLTSVYEDLRYADYDFLPKANANRLLIRNCVEANLILNVLENRPALAKKYYATRESDEERIKTIYAADKVADEEKEKKRFMKRFAWLPRYQGKKAKTMSDLLNYVEFENERQKEEYKIVIKHFDSFIHPSFNLAQSLTEEKKSGSILDVVSLLADNGIFYDAAYNLYLLFASIYAAKFPAATFAVLKDILVSPPYSPAPIPLAKEELLSLPYTADNKYAIMTGVYGAFDLKRQYQKNAGLSPDYLGGVPYIIGLIANYVCAFTPVSYKTRNVIFLLRDLTPRYDDMLRSVYEKNAVLFYAQSRYVVEALSVLSVLLTEDEARSRAYAVHQRVKSFDARVGAAKFINENIAQTPLRAPRFDDENIAAQHEKDLDAIAEYYRNNFNATVERRLIERLNGWALFLKGVDNDAVPNSPYFVELMCAKYYPGQVKQISSMLLALFEESNAFTHVTPYGFAFSRDEFDLELPLVFINDLTTRLISDVLTRYKLSDYLTREQMNEIDIGFFKAMSAIKKNKTRKLKKTPQ